MAQVDGNADPTHPVGEPLMTRFNRVLVWLLLCAMAPLVSPSNAAAQFETGAVVGTVRDNSGAVVPGATVTLLSAETGVSVTKTTDGEGNYEFFTVRPGAYKVTVELPGFATAFADRVPVSVGGRQRVDLTMTVGQQTETVEVVGGARTLETDSSQRGQVISGRQATELPLNGREYSALAQLSPGVRLSALNTGGLTPREGAFNVNGLRSTFNNFLIDGVDNNAYGTSNQGFSNQVMQPPPDALAEFRVVTNNMSAEYGRSGGATINVAYKSGGNRFSGAGWEFFRDTSMNAEGFFKTAAGKPELKRNQFGYVFGGPILKNRAFFFTDYEGFRQDREVVTLSTIASEAQRQGILSVEVRDPRTNTFYPAGTPLPMTPFARKVLSDLPATTTGAAGANNYRTLQLFENTTDKVNGKVDVTVSPALSLFGRYGYRDVDIFDNPPFPLPSGGSGNGETYVTNKQFATGATWAQSGTSLLEVRFGYSYTIGGKNPPALGSTSALEAYGISGLPTDERVAGGLPTQLITGYADLGRQATNPQWQYPRVFNPKVNYSWVMSRHSFKSGYEFQHVQTEVQDVNPLYGRDTYAGQFSRPPVRPEIPQPAANNLYNLADFMFGLRSQYALSNILVANLRQNMHFLYVQDDWRLNDKLTLNLGLRYEYATPWVEKDNILTNFDPTTLTMVQARDGSIEDRSTLQPDRNNWGPRLGFAWTLDPKTVVRGGYGKAYVHFHRAGGANVLPINGPQVINAVVNQTPGQSSSPFVPTELGYPAGLTDPSRFNPAIANITYMPRDYRSTGVQSWFISAQREILPRTVLDVAYVGNRSDDALLFANYNQALPNNAAGTIPLASRRLIAGFGDITYSFNGGFSRYHAFQMKFESRLVSGLTLLNSLTLSKTTDNGSGSLENQNGNAPAPQDFYNLAADEGYSNYHQPYNNTTSVIWELPIGRGRRFLSDASPWLDAVAGGWMVSGINFLYSGEPVTFIYTAGTAFQVSGIAQDFRGANNYRPNVIGDPYGDKSAIVGYFNPANVVIPTDPSQPFGNAERNSVRGPLFWQIDFVASKNFALPFGSRTQAQFRLEAFNLLNRTNLRAPNGNRSAAGFGTITQTYDARQLQLGIKVSF
jgi:outer membrane receptor protein involved in Fe transport